MSERIYVGVDDTDSLEEGGTGQLARELAYRIQAEPGLQVHGVSRHPLSKDPRVPCTRKNQCSCLVVEEAPDVGVAWRGAIREIVVERSVAGSDPGLCIAAESQISDRVIEWGFDAKRILLDQPGAFGRAREAGVSLEALGGDGDGVIGALAAVGLRRSGQDGRLTLWRGIRELTGKQPVSRLLKEGIDAVLDDAGNALAEDVLVETQGKVRPLIRDGGLVLRVEATPEGWQLLGSHSRRSQLRS